MKRKFKRLKKKILLFFTLFLILGTAIGYFGSIWLTKNDTFELIGDKNITLNINDEYDEQSVKVISYGIDLKDKVSIDSNIDTSKEGEYRVIYTVNSLKYKNIKRVRYITVRNGSENND